MSPPDGEGIGALMDQLQHATLPGEEELRAIELTEHGIAAAFARRHEQSLRYCHSALSWYCWDGTIWQKQRTRLAFHWARELCQSISEREGAEGKVKALLARASTASAVERFAQADPVFAVVAETWDQNRWLLGTPGGTVDLRTGALRPSRREDLITRQTTIAPAPAGTPHPLWSGFLDQATKGDRDLQDFLQRLAGYLLTGDVSEEVLAFLYGDGGNGKGVFISALTSILGAYGVTVPIEVFTAGSRINLEYYRAQMAGARLVTASETEAGATWAESQIKEMTGNEAPLSARSPHAKPFTYWPQFKIVIVGNHAPRLKGRTPAMERRLRIAPFAHKPERPDPHLKEKLAAELPAILRWMIEGCTAWQQVGLGAPACIRAASEAYFEQQDTFGRWLRERCILDATLSERPGRLYTDFAAWAKANGEEPPPSNEFAELIDRTSGLKRTAYAGARLIRGVGLQAAAATSANRHAAD